MNIKKIICFVQMVILVALSALPVHAYEVSAETEGCNSNITEIEAIELANRLYLKVNDNWSTSAKYVDTSLLGSSYATMFEICKVIP